MNDVNPDYGLFKLIFLNKFKLLLLLVVVGETKHYDFHTIERAVHHVKNGAKLIGTNRDIMDKVGQGFVPSTG